MASINAAYIPSVSTGAFPHQQGNYPAPLACSKRFSMQLKVAFGTV